MSYATGRLRSLSTLYFISSNNCIVILLLISSSDFSASYNCSFRLFILFYIISPKVSFSCSLFCGKFSYVVLIIPYNAYSRFSISTLLIVVAKFIGVIECALYKSAKEFNGTFALRIYTASSIPEASSSANLSNTIFKLGTNEDN